MPLHLIRGSLAGGVLTMTLISLVGCTSTHKSPHSDAVAHLPSSTAARGHQTSGGADPSGAAPTSTSATIRPRSKLFETEQESEANMVPYDNCMRAHHVQVSPLGKPLVTTQPSLARAVAADKACADKQPLPPIEEDPANPKALRFNRAVAACLRSHGVTEVTVVNEGGVINLSFGNGSVGLGLRYVDRCQHAVARQHH